MGLGSLGGAWAVVSLILYIVVAIFAAIAVYRDAQERTESELFLGLEPIWWAAMTLVGAILGVAAYWLIHYSSLRCEKESSARTE